jgi:hypothetical protein
MGRPGQEPHGSQREIEDYKLTIQLPSPGADSKLSLLLPVVTVDDVSTQAQMRLTPVRLKTLMALCCPFSVFELKQTTQTACEFQGFFLAQSQSRAVRCCCFISVTISLAVDRIKLQVTSF